MLLRSIRQTRGRFFAILAIVALGVGFFAGLKNSQPAMLNTVDIYYHTQRMYDFQLMSSLGLTDEDVEAFRGLPGVVEAEGGRFVDAWAALGSNSSGNPEVFHFMSLTEQVATPALLTGRMPERENECLGDAAFFSERDLGKELLLTEENSAETLDGFTQKQFTLVGIVRSPRYISQDRGSSTLGSGKQAAFVMVPAGAFSEDVWYEILLFCDLPGKIYSEEYNEALRRMESAVETLLNRRGVLRVKELRADADAELEKARRELDDGWIQYRLGKRKSKRELDAALKKLTAAQEQLNASRRTLEQNEATLAETEQSVLRQRTALTERQTELSLKKTELAAEKAEFNYSGKLAELYARRFSAEAEHSAALSPYALELAGIYARILILQMNPAASAEEIAALEQERETAQQNLNAAEAALEEEFQNTLRALDEEEEQLKAEQAQFSEREAALSQEETELQTLEIQIEISEQSLGPAREQLRQARLTLEAGERELSAGWEEYNRGKEKAEKELADALKKLEAGEEELRKAEEELEKKLQLDLYTLDRKSNAGYVTFQNDTAIVDGIAAAFPLFFVLVAALVCVTTMTRMVHEERTQIGTLKAIGYAAGAIMAKYLLYAGISSLLGCVFGFALGCTVLPWIVWYAYNIIYAYTELIFRYSLPMFLGCLIVSVAGSVAATWYAGRSALREKPAELIRPKAPAVGKRVLLERIPFLWRRLPFLSKVSIRNAFRYPNRVLMMILGIGGCTALMLAGFGAKDSIAKVAEYQYEEIALYDISVTTEEGVSLSREDWEDAVGEAYREEIRLENGEDGKDTELILGTGEEMEKLLNLHRKDGSPIPWPGPGEVVITQKLSEILGLKTGDEAVLLRNNQQRIPVRVSGVCEYFVGHAVFASPVNYGNPAVNSVYIRVREGEDIGRRAAQLRTKEGVQYVSLTQTERDIMESSMASLDLLVLMLVFCSGALAFITLLNLTNINLMERIREVATVKVLGFTPQETAAYTLNENLLLSVLGAVFGLVLGKYLHRFVIEMVQVEYMSFNIRIALLSYVLSFGLTLLFALLTNLFMRRKLEAVNMAESLKSVE